MQHCVLSWGESWDSRAVSIEGLMFTITPPVTGSDGGSGAGGAITFPIDVNGGRSLDRKLVPLEAKNSNIEILALGSLTEFFGKEGALLPAESGSAMALAVGPPAPTRPACLGVGVA